MHDRQKHWEGIYQRTGLENLSWYQNETLLSSELIASVCLSLEAAVIDVGGGASVLVDWLIREGYRDITVLDISPAALAASRTRLGDVAGDVTWLEADVTLYEPKQQYSLWHDRAAFHFLTEAIDRENYREVLERSVRPGGDVVIATFGLDGPKRCSGLDVVRYDAESLAGELGPAFRLLHVRHEVHRTPQVMEQQFTYCHFRRVSTS